MVEWVAADLASHAPMRRTGEIVDDELMRWFEREGLVRYAVYGEPDGGVTEVARGPLVALGPYDDDYYLAPHPERLGYRLKPLREMSFDDFQAFMLSWFEHAIRAGDARCADCDRLILATTDDMADADTWDAIFVEKELVAWMLCHFDCKKQLPRRLKGRHPFELRPRPAPAYDLSDEIHGAPLAEPDDAEGAGRAFQTEEDTHG
jgi:hypothetical protein